MALPLLPFIIGGALVVAWSSGNGTAPSPSSAPSPPPTPPVPPGPRDFGAIMRMPAHPAPAPMAMPIAPRQRRAARRMQPRPPVSPSAPQATMSQPKKSLANLMQQPLEVAVDAARHRFVKGPVTAVTQGEGHIVVHLDPSSTSAVLVPPHYLGWPVKMVAARTVEPTVPPHRAPVPATPG